MSALIQDSPFAFHRGRQRRAKAQLPLELARPHYQQIPRCSQIPARPTTRAAPQQFRPRIVRHHHEQIVVAVRPRIASRHRAEQVDSLGPISLGQPPHHLVQRRIVGSENRGLDQPGPGMTPALAEGILALDFPKGDAARIDELNVRANEGQLTCDEQAELEAYINVGDLLACWQSKARQAVQPGIARKS